ncbi:hypothetical protein CFHF_14055 [Caulobacter flavus]|uniref:Uncharacterized protein n=1 Tax=Caulobacter flavus TaxID=1679497 RepID=A0A2N5CS83_9CAUL|nr:DUF6491 family protein [Caulobacter flavus]AYV49106.1 hypothetical protein C1707_24195 [Caulobacter flavus]PLR13307.1 hypothetical protein CFHF_14055 [Caulobacter flavus]
MHRTALIAFGLAAALASPVLAETPAPKAKTSTADRCFFADQIRGYQVVDDRTLNVDLGRKEGFQLTLLNTPFDLDVSTRIGIKSRGGSWICSPLDASVVVPEVTGSSRSYRVQTMRKLTAEEYAAAWPGVKAKKPKS